MSHESPADFDPAPFAALHDWLASTFPHARGVLEREKIGAASLLYTWPGSDASLQPVLLTSHLDVVPVPDPESWTHPPFAGVIADGFVWGRGTLDDKTGVVATIEAIDRLARQGFRPRRTVLDRVRARRGGGRRAGRRRHHRLARGARRARLVQPRRGPRDRAARRRLVRRTCRSR